MESDGKSQRFGQDKQPAAAEEEEEEEDRLRGERRERRTEH